MMETVKIYCLEHLFTKDPTRGFIFEWGAYWREREIGEYDITAGSIYDRYGPICMNVLPRRFFSRQAWR